MDSEPQKHCRTSCCGLASVWQAAKKVRRWILSLKNTAARPVADLQACGKRQKGAAMDSEPQKHCFTSCCGLASVWQAAKKVRRWILSLKNTAARPVAGLQACGKRQKGAAMDSEPQKHCRTSCCGLASVWQAAKKVRRWILSLKNTAARPVADLQACGKRQKGAAMDSEPQKHCRKSCCGLASVWQAAKKVRRWILSLKNTAARPVAGLQACGKRQKGAAMDSEPQKHCRTSCCGLASVRQAPKRCGDGF